MAWRGRRDAHGVDAAFEKRLLIREAQRDAMLLLHLPQPLRIRFEHGMQLQSVRRFQHGNMPVIRDGSTAHQSNLFHILSSYFLL